MALVSLEYHFGLLLLLCSFRSLGSFDLQSDLLKVKYTFAQQASTVPFPLLPFPIIWFHGWGNIGEKSGAEMQYRLTQHHLEVAIEIVPLSRRREVSWEWSYVVWNNTRGSDLETLCRRETT